MKNDKFVLKENWIYFIAMALFSFTIIALETIYFHMLLVVTNYLNATFIFSLAMLGIGAGSILSFYLLKIRTYHVIVAATVLFFFSMIFAYYNIVSIGTMTYPVFLCLPFFFGTVIVSSIFSKADSAKLYFVNLIFSALGVIYPIFSISAFKSENSLILLLLVPALFLLVLSFGYKNKVLRYLVLLPVSVVSIVLVLALFAGNQALIEKIPARAFEKEIKPLVKNDLDLAFLKRVCKYSPDSNFVLVQGDVYDKKRMRYLLNQIRWKPARMVDLNFDVKPHPSINKLNKIYNLKLPLVLSEDDLMGRVELFSTATDNICYAANGVILDNIKEHYGAIFDPRVPHLVNPKVFIIGLSADGIVKPSRNLPGARVSGIEICPIIIRIMTENGPFRKASKNAYDDTVVFEGEGRSFLSSTNAKYDMIFLMNIHAEHGPICTLSPEYVHTVEATRELLNKLTPRGYIVYEEIIENSRSSFFFLKFINTIKESMKGMGITDPEKNILVYSWDFWSSNNTFRTLIIKKEPFHASELSGLHYFMNQLTNHYPSIEKTYVPGHKSGTSLERFITSPSVHHTNQLPNLFYSRAFEKILTEIPDTNDRAFLAGHYSYGKKERIYYLKKNSNDDRNRLLRILKSAGHPVEIDLTPITDDKPFPYNVYKDKTEVIALLKLVALLCLVIFVPVMLLILIRFGKNGLTLPLHILYFGILGFGYMLVEIVLMQKYQLFIGTPTYSMIVILGGLLFFSGLGSFASRNFSKKALAVSTGLIAVLLLLNLFFAESLFTIFAQATFINKIIISVAMIFPLAFLMGIPFPHALEQVKKDISNEYSTLMYGISAVFSTLASTISLLVSVTFGFSATLAIGIACYSFSLLIFFFLKK